MTHASGLCLVYTRRGAHDDQVFRHRAPLFIARVDPDSLRVVRATEQALIPETGLDLGNFGVTDVSPRETWVVTSEAELARAGRQGPNRMLLAKILWDR